MIHLAQWSLEQSNSLCLSAIPAKVVQFRRRTPGTNELQVVDDFGRCDQLCLIGLDVLIAVLLEC
eukprot:9202453-Pyramimonas_sp.AAC.1